MIVDGARGLEALPWSARCGARTCRSSAARFTSTATSLAHAPKHLHDELTRTTRDMIYADTAAEIETRRKAFLRKWRLKCRAVADFSLEEAGDRLFTLHPPLDPSQWKIGPEPPRPSVRMRAFALPGQRSSGPETVSSAAASRPQTVLPLRRDRAHAALGAARFRPDPDGARSMVGTLVLSPLAHYSPA